MTKVWIASDGSMHSLSLIDVLAKMNLLELSPTHYDKINREHYNRAAANYRNRYKNPEKKP